MGKKRRMLIHDLEKEMAGIMQKLEERENVLEKIPEPTEELQTEILELCRRYKELDNKRGEYQRAENTEELLKSGRYFTQDNSISIALNSRTKTTPIIHSFVWSDKKYLILKYMFLLPPAIRHASLVVTKTPSSFAFDLLREEKRISYVSTSITISDLKSKSGLRITQDILERMPEYEKTKMYSLYKELVAIEKKNISDGGYFPFSIPVEFGAQTFDDQRDFGWEYNGRSVVKIGKQYGETKKFLIIGVYI